ncbi:hypothetical protein TNIN_77171 [Trichonephila inaurata madagascariensis]|uniref:Uncharacterized protein n=1 Tax=Trichonephila inaurata madagascariensis TaxID=2747483 RepID=A0A8X6Y9P9_9ARAC|nr:hypothetical protein TNIN_77171 [Trichonephila inaurata madagascariensis]
MESSKRSRSNNSPAVLPIGRTRKICHNSDRSNALPDSLERFCYTRNDRPGNNMRGGQFYLLWVRRALLSGNLVSLDEKKIECQNEYLDQG